MRPRSARNAAQCKFFIFKEIPKFQVTLPALVAGMWPGHVTTVKRERGKEGVEGEGTRGLHDCIAPSLSIGGPPPGPIKPPEVKLAAFAVLRSQLPVSALGAGLLRTARAAPPCGPNQMYVRPNQIFIF